MKKWLVLITLFMLTSFLLAACIENIQVSDKDGAKMVYVPQGEFTMGIEGHYDLWPVHKVTLDSYWIDQTEVTNAMYAKCVSDGVCEEPSDKSSSTRPSYFGNSEFDDYPVIYVDWKMANTYCEWRGDKLPTEAQWEKAARGTDGRTYPWGEIIDCSFTNYRWTSPDYRFWENNHDCIGDTTKVGSYENGKSPYGLYDMVGNVAEWVADWYPDGDTYNQNSPSLNPLGPNTGTFRMARGGSWFESSSDMFPISMDSITQSTFYTGDDVGFRCARSAP